MCNHDDVANGKAASLLWKIIVFALLVILVLELTLSIRRETQTWDEACHIFAGYSYWRHGDFGMNPEHPPLVKLVATLPMLPLSLKVPPHPKVFSKEEDFTAATQFVYDNNAETILFRTRMGAAVFTLMLAILLFSAAREMFGACSQRPHAVESLGSELHGHGPIVLWPYLPPMAIMSECLFSASS